MRSSPEAVSSAVAAMPRTNGVRIPPLRAPANIASIHVLILGDAAYAGRITTALVSPEIALIVCVTTEADLLAKLMTDGFDCVIADRTTAGRNIGDLLSTIDQHVLVRPAVILVTAAADNNVILKAFRCGIGDVVTMDHNVGQELVLAVRRSVERNRRTQALVEENAYLSLVSRTDRLTGVPDRAHLEERLATLVSAGRRARKSFAALRIGIDDFDRIQDAHGQSIADQLIKAFARKLMAASRTSDAIGRIGGQEFLYVIDRDVTPGNLELACARLVQQLAFRVDLDSISVELSARIGCAMFPDDGGSGSDLMDAAHRALSIATADGSPFHVLPGAAGGAKANRNVAADPMGAEETDTPVAPAGTIKRAADRRREHRNRVLRRGRIILGDGFSTIDCVVRDLSPHGARVSVNDLMSAPASFKLCLVEEGILFDAARRWQHGQNIGMEFQLDAAVPPGTNGIQGLTF